MKRFAIVLGWLLCSCQSQPPSTPPPAPAVPPPQVVQEPPPAPVDPGAVVLVLDDFEGKGTRFEDKSQKSYKVAYELVSGGKVGSKALKATITGKKNDGWSAFMIGLDNGWPKGADRVTFWARGDRETTILLAVREGDWPNQGGHGAEIQLTSRWQPYSVGLDELTFFIWGMGDITDKTKVDPTNVVAIGFAEHPDKDMPVTFYIDQFQFEKAAK